MSEGVIRKLQREREGGRVRDLGREEDRKEGRWNAGREGWNDGTME